MAQLGQAFDPNSVAPSTGGGGPLHPAGDFQFEVQESDVKPNSKGTGQVMSGVLVNLGNAEDESQGADKGKKVYFSINVAHENAQTQTIGQGELSAMCAAAELVETLTDSNQLHYRPLWARIGHEAMMSKESNFKSPMIGDDGKPKMKAVVLRYLFGDAEAAPATPATKAAATPAPATAAPASGGRTWQRKTA